MSLGGCIGAGLGFRVLGLGLVFRFGVAAAIVARLW